MPEHRRKAPFRQRIGTQIYTSPKIMGAGMKLAVMPNPEKLEALEEKKERKQVDKVGRMIHKELAKIRLDMIGKKVGEGLQSFH